MLLASNFEKENESVGQPFRLQWFEFVIPFLLNWFYAKLKIQRFFSTACVSEVNEPKSLGIFYTATGLELCLVEWTDWSESWFHVWREACKSLKQI